MFIVDILSWWYSAGWRQQGMLVKERLATTIDFFSIDLLARTLFAPFRQISAGRVDGPLSVKLQALLDRMISRLIGGMVRSTMIVVGVGAIVVHGVIGVLRTILWALIPVVPLIGIVLFVIGWTPWVR